MTEQKMQPGTWYFLGEMCNRNCKCMCVCERKRKRCYKCVCVQLSGSGAVCRSADVVCCNFSGLKIWCHELFHFYIHVSSPWMNSAAHCYIDRAVKRTGGTLTQPVELPHFTSARFNNSCLYSKRHKDQKSIQYPEVCRRPVQS